MRLGHGKLSHERAMAEQQVTRIIADDHVRTKGPFNHHSYYACKRTRCTGAWMPPVRRHLSHKRDGRMLEGSAGPKPNDNEFRDFRYTSVRVRNAPSLRKRKSGRILTGKVRSLSAGRAQSANFHQCPLLFASDPFGVHALRIQGTRSHNLQEIVQAQSPGLSGEGRRAVNPS